jgi:hypothetical protein
LSSSVVRAVLEVSDPAVSSGSTMITTRFILSVRQGHLPESWRRYLRNLLNEPTGMILRNRVSHGLLPRGGRGEAALALHAACFLRLLKARQPTAPEAQPG